MKCLDKVDVLEALMLNLNDMLEGVTLNLDDVLENLMSNVKKGNVGTSLSYRMTIYVSLY